MPLIGKIFTIDYTNVHGWSTSVYLEEIPNISFNSVNFVDVILQSKEDDNKHPQLNNNKYISPTEIFKR